jgi:cytochrome c oxidase subunit 4
MQSDHAGHAHHGGHDAHDVRSHVRLYWMIGAALYVFTIITVAVNQVHLAIPLAITVALIVATIKGSMVATVFMHLSNEKRWIYGSLLLTAFFFVAMMVITGATLRDTIGTPTVHEVSTGAAHPGALEH